MAIDPVATLSELVAIASVNPMGRPVSGPEFYEYRVTDYLQALFERLGLPWQRQHVEPQRENILARLDGQTPLDKGGRLVLLEAHQDTVPVDGMTIDPWTPTVRNGRLYGRGACDIKGGMAAMLAAVARLADERPAAMPSIVMACTINEEHGFTGATALTRLWTAPADSILPRRPDLAIVAEPTQLNVVVAHKGTVRWRLHTSGRAAHSSQPLMGDNALYKMARVLLALERYAGEVTASFARHPLCGPATLSVGTIRGGLSVNTVPDQATIEIDRRVLPGEDASVARQHVIDYLAAAPEITFPLEHERAFLTGPALSDGANGDLADRLSAVARRVCGGGDKVGVPYGTDASTIAAAQVPSVVFGPGSIDQAHTADEWLSLDELAAASEVLYEFLRDGG